MSEIVTEYFPDLSAHWDFCSFQFLFDQDLVVRLILPLVSSSEAQLTFGLIV